MQSNQGYENFPEGQHRVERPRRADFYRTSRTVAGIENNDSGHTDAELGFSWLKLDKNYATGRWPSTSTAKNGSVPEPVCSLAGAILNLDRKIRRQYH